MRFASAVSVVVVDLIVDVIELRTIDNVSDWVNDSDRLGRVAEDDPLAPQGEGLVLTALAEPRVGLIDNVVRCDFVHHIFGCYCSGCLWRANLAQPMDDTTVELPVAPGRALWYRERPRVPNAGSQQSGHR